MAREESTFTPVWCDQAKTDNRPKALASMNNDKLGTRGPIHLTVEEGEPTGHLRVWTTT